MPHKSGLTDIELEKTQAALQIFCNIMPSFVYPIYQNSGNGKPDLIGSGFIIEAHGRCFFVTAAHVFDHHSSQNPLFYFTAQQYRQVLDGPAEFSPSNKKNRDDDKIDIAVIALSSEQAKPAPEMGKSTITPDKIDVNSAEIPDCRFIVAGYPLTKHKPDTQNKLLNPKCYTWFGKTVSDAPYAHLRLSRHENILVQFSRRHTVRHDGKTGGMFPEPRGISGAPVWRTVGKRNKRGILVIDDILLVGVLIEHIKEQKSLLATSINHVLNLINILSRKLSTVEE